MRCLAKTPADRPASARDLAREFHDALMLSQSSPPPDEALRSPFAETDPAQPAASTPTPLPTVPATYDPNAVTYRMEAWMPDAIASYKLRGFVNDHDGEVIESVPGRIRVRLGGKAIQDSGTTRSPDGDVPPLRNNEPNLTRSDMHVLMPPSNIPVPTGSTPMVASCQAPSLAHSSRDISSGICSPPTASHIQPNTSVSQDRYSNGPPCGDFRCNVSR